MTQDPSSTNMGALNFLMDAQKSFYEQLCVSQAEERQRQELERKHRILGLTMSYHSNHEQHQQYQQQQYEQQQTLLPAFHSHPDHHGSDEILDALLQYENTDLERSQDFSLFPIDSLEQDDLIEPVNHTVSSSDRPLLRNSRLRRASLDFLASMFENDDSLNRLLGESEECLIPDRTESNSMTSPSKLTIPPAVPMKSKIATETILYNQLLALQEAMETTQGSQEKLHELDTEMGLKKSHSRTMRSSFQSRKKLIKKHKKETKRLAPRVTVLTGSLPKMSYNKKPIKPCKTLNKEIKFLPSNGAVIIQNPLKQTHAPHAA
mmetsp:Transcript_28044/g.39421  ORF Transcript_28044/g.39421 Transcript_28044/m.39421 type:complete len:320 (+) Transcript_28044:134-1093(+)